MCLRQVKILSEYIHLNLWLSAVTIVLFAYDGTISHDEGIILLFINLVGIVNIAKINKYLFGIRNNNEQ